MFGLNVIRLESFCEMRQTNLITPDEDSMSQTYHIYEPKVEMYEILSWSEDEINAIPIDKGNGCRVNELRFNFKTKEFYLFTRNGSGECKLGSDVTLPPLPRPRITQIVDGEKIFREEFFAIRMGAFDVIAGETKMKAQVLIDKAEKEAAKAE